MSRTIIHPVIDRMVLGYAAAVPVAAYVGVASTALVDFFSSQHSMDSLGRFFTVFAAIVLAGTLTLPVAFVAGLPAFVCACWLAIQYGIRATWCFAALGIVGSAAGSYLLLPLFKDAGRLSRDLSDPLVLVAWMNGLMILAPAGILAGWIFGRVSFGWSMKDVHRP